MPYGTKDGYAPATPKEQLALDIFNIAHGTAGAFAVTWDTLHPEDLLKVNAIYARIGEYEHPPIETTLDYYSYATGLSEKQWNLLVDVSRDMEIRGRYLAADHFAPGRATLKSLVRRGLLLHMADGSYKTTDLGEKVVHALD